jgi:hypothetical protein
MDTRIGRPDAIVWIDRETAIITDLDPGGDRPPMVECLARGAGEPSNHFEARAVDEVLDDQLVAVAGPIAARVSFERRFVAVTHRPDRLVDVETAVDAPDVADHPIRRRAD